VAQARDNGASPGDPTPAADVATRLICAALDSDCVLGLCAVGGHGFGQALPTRLPKALRKALRRQAAGAGTNTESQAKAMREARAAAAHADAQVPPEVVLQRCGAMPAPIATGEPAAAAAQTEQVRASEATDALSRARSAVAEAAQVAAEVADRADVSAGRADPRGRCRIACLERALASAAAEVAEAARTQPQYPTPPLSSVTPILLRLVASLIMEAAVATELGRLCASKDEATRRAAVPAYAAAACRASGVRRNMQVAVLAAMQGHRDSALGRGGGSWGGLARTLVEFPKDIVACSGMPRAQIGPALFFPLRRGYYEFG
jgi:hypothetical protein